MPSHRGRPKGGTNKRIKSITAAEILMGRETPLAFLVNVYTNKDETKERQMDAAKAAAPYFHARLSMRELTGADGGPINVAEARVEIVAEIPHNGREPAHRGKVIPLRRREA